MCAISGIRTSCQFARVTELERAAARLEGERGPARRIGSAGAQGRISEIEMQIIQVDQDLAHRGRAASSPISAPSVSEFVERRIAAEDQLMRTEIRAPQSGQVHQLAVHTVGGVISPGEPIMLIVPDADALIVEARVLPQDIDQITLGQEAVLRFSAFNRRTTPELPGMSAASRRTSPSRPQSGAAYYTIRVASPPEEITKLGEGETRAGNARRRLHPDNAAHRAVLSGAPAVSGHAEGLQGELSPGQAPNAQAPRPRPPRAKRNVSVSQMPHRPANGRISG